MLPNSLNKFDNEELSDRLRFADWPNLTELEFKQTVALALARILTKLSN